MGYATHGDTKARPDQCVHNGRSALVQALPGISRRALIWSGTTTPNGVPKGWHPSRTVSHSLLHADRTRDYTSCACRNSTVCARAFCVGWPGSSTRSSVRTEWAFALIPYSLPSEESISTAMKLSPK